MKTAAVLLLTMVTLSPVLAQEPPSILQITIERLKPGANARYAEIEERLANLCTSMACPNAYLALESLTAPPEVWWLVMYESQADVDRVANAYAQNRVLLDALNQLNALKKDLTETPIGHMTKRRASAGAAAPWRVGTEPFAVIAAIVIAATADAAGGSVFETADGTQFAIASAAARAERPTRRPRSSAQRRGSSRPGPGGASPTTRGWPRTRGSGDGGDPTGATAGRVTLR